MTHFLDDIKNPIAPEPKPLLAGVLPPEPYPMDALPLSLQRAAKAIEKLVQAPKALAGQSVIAAAAYLAQPRVNAPDPKGIDSEGKPCSLFILTLGKSGDRKSECRKQAFKTIDKAERQALKNYTSENKHREGVIVQLKGTDKIDYLEQNPEPAYPKTLYSDATFESIASAMIEGTPAASLDTDEGGQFFGGSSLKADTRAATIGGFIKAFDDGGFERTRAKSNANASGTAYNRRLSIHVLAQPVAVQEALGDDLLKGQGFLPRFLFANAPSIAGTRFSQAESEKASYVDQLREYWTRCEQLQAITPSIDDEGEITPPVCELDDSGKEAYTRFYNSVEKDQGALGQYYTITPFAARAGELALRLATVFAFFEQRQAIDGELMGSACKLVEYSLQEWLRQQETRQPSDALIQAQALYDWLTDDRRAEKWARFHKNQLCGESPVRGKAKNRDSCLDVLLKHGHLTTDDNKHFCVRPREKCAYSAYFAETQQPRGFQSADSLHTSAEKSGSGAFYADVCKASASAKPVTTGVYADYALYAPFACSSEEKAHETLPSVEQNRPQDDGKYYGGEL